MVYNVLDLPAGCLPVTRVDPSLDAITEEWFQGPGHGSPLFENGIFKGPNALYNAQRLEGMPVCVQVVCKKWEEEKLLRVMSLVDETLGERGFGPGAVDRWAESKAM
jgi:amidase